MGIGDTIKASADAVRDMLGTDFTLNGETALGKCSYEELAPIKVRAFLGEDYADEIEFPWLQVEAPAGSGITEGDKLTCDATSKDWIVRRVMQAMAGGVVIAERCLCIGKTVE